MTTNNVGPGTDGQGSTSRGHAPACWAGSDIGLDAVILAKVLDRDLQSCVRCGIPVSGKDYTIHSRVQGAKGASSLPGWILMCGGPVTGCHGWTHAHPADALVFGWMLKTGDDPLLVPVAYGRRGGGFSEYWLTADGGRETDPPPGG